MSNEPLLNKPMNSPQPTDYAGIRRCWPAYENEAGEKGRWVIAD